MKIVPNPTITQRDMRTLKHILDNREVASRGKQHGMGYSQSLRGGGLHDGCRQDCVCTFWA